MKSISCAGIRLFAVFALMAATREDALAQDTARSSNAAVITIAAQGTASARPDGARVWIGVNTQASSAAEAASRNAARQNAVRASLIAAGATADSISTSMFAVRPEYFERGSAPRYVVDNIIRVNTRDFASIGKLIDAALGAGANRVDHIEFVSSQLDSLRRAALADAVRAARRDGEAAARAEGGELGDLIEISFGENRPYVPVEIQALVAPSEHRPGTSIDPRDITVRATVVARWKFEKP